jgi:pimeloyl-ACP methyl ester carboxylesterase
LARRPHVLAEVFARVMPHLARHFDVLAVDVLDAGENVIPDRVRGHSIDDMRDFVWQFMDAMRLDRAHFLGNCWGGTLIALMAIEEPTRMLSSVLTAPPFFDDRLPTFFRLLTTPGASQLIRWAAPRSRSASRAVLEDSVHDASVLDHPITDSHLVVPALQARWLDYLAAMLDTCATPLGPKRALRERLSTERLMAAQVDLLLLWGRENTVVPSSGAGAVANCPRFTVHLLDRCNHLAPFEVPDAVVELALRHFAAHP